MVKFIGSLRHIYALLDRRQHALATELMEHDLARYFLLEKAEILEKFMCECMTIFDQYSALLFSPYPLVQPRYLHN